MKGGSGKKTFIFFLEESRMRMRWEIAVYARIVRRDDEERTGGRDGDKAKERIGGEYGDTDVERGWYRGIGG